MTTDKRFIVTHSVIELTTCAVYPGWSADQWRRQKVLMTFWWPAWNSDTTTVTKQTKKDALANAIERNMLIGLLSNDNFDSWLLRYTCSNHKSYICLLLITGFSTYHQDTVAKKTAETNICANHVVVHQFTWSKVAYYDKTEHGNDKEEPGNVVVSCERRDQLFAGLPFITVHWLCFLSYVP